MTFDDIPQVVQVADQIHPGLPEGEYVFAERVKLFPKGCLVLVLVDGSMSKILGYAVSHPIRYRQPPALDSLLGEIPPDADQYYIHDVAVLPEYRGHGSAAKAVQMLLEVTGEYTYETTCLVSVYGTGPLWRRFGFEEELAGRLREKLRGYGEDAVYMSRRNLLKGEQGLMQ